MCRCIAARKPRNVLFAGELFEVVPFRHWPKSLKPDSFFHDHLEVEDAISVWVFRLETQLLCPVLRKLSPAVATAAEAHHPAAFVAEFRKQTTLESRLGESKLHLKRFNNEVTSSALPVFSNIPFGEWPGHDIHHPMPNTISRLFLKSFNQQHCSRCFHCSVTSQIFF